MGMEFRRKLPIPMEIKAQFPLTAEMERVKVTRDEAIRNIFTGKDDRFLVIVGPCSADAKEPVLEYVSRLAQIQEEISDRILIIPRVYTAKPRTLTDGYLGLFHQPDPAGKQDLLKGITAVRELHLEVLRQYGFTCADELLYPENHRYLSDLLSYAAVGARSAEDQQHRLTASGLDIPVGMKNPLSGDLPGMFHAVFAARQPHTFLYRGWEVESTGNPLAHGVLRGYSAPDGRMMANCGYDDLCRLSQEAEKHGVPGFSAVVDTNHANSGKCFERQPAVALDVMESRRKNPDLRRTVKGLMIESYLFDGAQIPGCPCPVSGRSYTDPCLGWEKTRRLLSDLAEKV